MRRALIALVASAALAAAVPASAAVAPAPAWTINSIAVPTNFVPGAEGSYEVRVENSGGAVADGTPLTVTDSLPAGLTVDRVELPLRAEDSSDGKIKIFDFGDSQCDVQSSGGSQTVTCTVPATLLGTEPAKLWPSEFVRMVIYVDVAPDLSGTLLNSVEVEGGGAPAATSTNDNEANPEPAKAGFQEFSAVVLGPDGQPQLQAASRPYQYTTSFAANTTPGTGSRPFDPAEGDIKDVEVMLPPGLVGNPTAAEPCPRQQFNSYTQLGPGQVVSNCPDSSVVGLIVVRQLEGKSPQVLASPIYNLVPDRGMPAQFGFQVASIPFYIDTSLRTGGDYGITAHVRNTSQLKAVTAASVTIWGVPADPRHDRLRGACLNHAEEAKPLSLGSCSAGVLDPPPFLRLPSSCRSPLKFVMSFDRWNAFGSFVSAPSTVPAPQGCAALDFGPSFDATPHTTVADSPTGLRVSLRVPQPEEAEEPGTADLRDAVVTLPAGVTVNPSQANGLQACSPAQIAIDSPAPASCPDAAKIGTVQITTPLLEQPVEGAVYVAAQNANPFGSLLAIYLAVHDPERGVVIKLAGHVEADPHTGQLKTTFSDNPQLPFEEFRLEFFDGPRAALRTPGTCGTYTTTTSFTPHSAPESGPPARPSDAFGVSVAPGGGPCAATEAQQPHAPAFAAGTLAPRAGAFSPFVMNLQRPDGSQTLRGLRIDLPPGLTGKLAGVPYCSEGALAAAAARPGREEQASASCPAASQVGSVNVGAGAGPSPVHVGGKVYLAGPYKGAPLSMAVITPAVAGPFDLGTVVVRAALRVDPVTAQVAVHSDPLPTILQGIPLDVRSIAVRVDRPDFTLNPTNCQPMGVGGEAASLANRLAPLFSRFEVGGCRGLGFKPRLYMRLFGGTKRAAHPKLRAVLIPRPGDANIGRAVVSLPRSEFLDQGNIRTICTRVQFAANSCPKGAVYGHAVAHSPLLDEPLRGPVHLRSSDNLLPDIVAVLRGQIDVELSGRVDSIKGGIRTTFAIAPDAPVSKFVLTLKGGPKQGLLVNSRDICAKAFRARANFTGHNGAKELLRPALKNSRCSKAKKRSRKGTHRRSSRR